MLSVREVADVGHFFTCLIHFHVCDSYFIPLVISDAGVFEDIIFLSSNEGRKTAFDTRFSHVLGTSHTDIVNVVGVGVDGFVIIFEENLTVIFLDQ